MIIVTKQSALLTVLFALTELYAFPGRMKRGTLPRRKRTKTTTLTTDINLFTLPTTQNGTPGIDYNMPVPQVTILSKGFMISLPHGNNCDASESSLPAISHLEIFLSVNQPLMISRPHYRPQYIAVVNRTRDGIWSYINRDVTLKDGDRVYYWIVVTMRDHHAYYELNDRMFIVNKVNDTLVAT